jgi:hypothetical protein
MMTNVAKSTAVAALAALAMGFSAQPVQAQRGIGFQPQRNLLFPGPFGYAGPPINRNWLVAPGLNIRQATYNTAMFGRAASYIPPYLLGYNPYPQAVNYGSLYTSSPYASPYINPYAAAAYSNPYAALYGGGYGSGYGASALTSATGLPDSGSYNPYGSGSYYGESPSGGFLRGTADVINAQGRLVIELEQAKLAHEQVRQAKIDTRRKLFDEIMYERQHTPSYTVLREQAIAENLRRSQSSAPVTEIWSAKALNDILADLGKLHGKKIYGPNISLDPDVLKQINVVGKGSGNIGLLRNEGQLNWPQGLRDLKPKDASAELRSNLDAKAVEAVNQATTPPNRVNSGVIRDLQANVAKLHRLLAKNVNELPANEYIEAKRFLNNFDDAIRALQDPNVGNYFNNTYVAKGKTVQDLVDYMVEKGLTFAPATSGDEAAYRALHSALAAYDIAIHPDPTATASTAKE